MQVLTPASKDAEPYAVCRSCGSIFAAPLPKNRVPVLPPGVRAETTGERTWVAMGWFRPIALIIIPAMLFMYVRYGRNEPV